MAQLFFDFLESLQGVLIVSNVAFKRLRERQLGVSSS
jgi:hypothetical protein